MVTSGGERMGRGQSSIEYLMIVGIALGLLVPAVFFFVSYSNTQRATGISSQINDIGIAVVTAAAESYALGTGARRQVEVNIPAEVTRIWVDGNELAIRYETPHGPSEAVFFASISLNSSSSDGNVTVPHEGITRLRLVSLGTSVNLTEVTT